MRTPNIEQLLAIKNKGGVTLAAGAGAGKTFVLVEHLVHRLDAIFHDDLQKVWNEKSISILQDKMLKIVMITFTKKAAGELATRIQERIELMLNSAEEMDASASSFWDQVQKNLHLISVSTIHSFCQKVLNQKIVHLPVGNFDVVDDIIYTDKIRKLFVQFLELHQGEYKKETLLFSHDVQKAILKIFQSVELRLRWEKSPSDINTDKEIEILFQEYLRVSGLKDFFDFKYVSIPEGKKGVWVEALKAYDQLAKSGTPLNWGFFLKTFQTLSEFSIRLPKDADIDQLEVLRQISAFNKKVKSDDFIDSVESFNENKGQLLEIYKFTRQAFLSISDRFYSENGISFNDLEYLILKYLDNTDARKLLSKLFDVIVIDEYQDTSIVQYEILKILTDNDFTKVFAVGDLKQAIYGFRGGEIDVFVETEKKVKENLSLSNNYRSAREVIEYNNQFFELIFPLGMGFQKIDKFQFKYQTQNVPEHVEKGQGLVSLQPVLLEVSKKPSAGTISRVEAREIAEQIDVLIQENQVESIAVLYRKLSNAKYLIDELTKRNIKFSAQSKILLKDEPLFVLVKALVEFISLKNNIGLDQELRKNIYVKLQAVMRLFGFNKEIIELQKELDIFHQNVSFWGLRFSIEKIMFDYGISDSRYSECWSTICSFIQVGNQDAQRVELLLKNVGELNSSTVYERAGIGPGVEILTVHASKGLEYDVVFVAGIHTNGGSPPDRAKVGESFLSFTWKKKKSDKKEKKTPWMILERALKAEKEFSESKRLLYVACTRAKKHLSFIDIKYRVHLPEEPKKHMEEFEPFFRNENSWINAIRLFEDTSYFKIQTEKFIKSAALVEEEEGSDSADFGDDLLEESNHAPPFLTSHLGIQIFERESQLGVVGEISVTKLSEIEECPRKFYFNSVLKLNSEELEVNYIEEESEDLVFVASSSKERGIEKHYEISQYFMGRKNKEQLSDESLWAISEIEKIKVDRFHSEKEIKFSFFGQMISGTPDWYAFNTEKNELVIIDFKTGQLNSEKILKYFAQVKIYAYGLLKSMNLGEEWTVKLLLMSIDEKKIIEQSLCKTDLFDQSFNIWQKISRLNQARVEHCSSCKFQTYCREK